jgi:dTDP-4-dehydrorhamnose reductase
MVLGGSGMLGKACDLVFSEAPNVQLVSTARQSLPKMRQFDVLNHSIKELILAEEPDWIINCIGIIKPHIKEDSSESVENAIRVNSVFPHEIANAISKTNTRVIQIATDCVYSGREGSYIETSPHDPTDTYGKTKSLGEVSSNQFLHIRASIIGPEFGRSTSLQEWFLGQPAGAKVNGFTDHLWNGLTTYHFALLSLALISEGMNQSGKHHVLPSNILSKAKLLETFAEVHGRQDINVEHIESTNKIDRTLATVDLDFSNQLWKLAGYTEVPTIQQMILEQKNFMDLHK